MSYRVGTPNYNLPQTEGTDKRDWADTNQAFLLIDTAIKSAADASASAGSAAAAAQESADDAATAATHAQTDATTAQTLARSASELATLAKNIGDDNSADIVTLNNKLTNVTKSMVITTDSHITNVDAHLIKNGNICSFDFNCTFALGLPYTSWFTLATLPADCRPMNEFSVPLVFSTNGQVNGECNFTPDGTVRFRCTTGSITLPAFEKIHAVYFTS